MTRMLESDTEAVQELANVILADLTLTQRLLRLANTLPYRAGSVPVARDARGLRRAARELFFPRARR